MSDTDTWLDLIFDKCFYEENFEGARAEAKQLILTKMMDVIGEDEVVADPKAHWTNSIPVADVPKVYRNELRSEQRKALKEKI